MDFGQSTSRGYVPASATPGGAAAAAANASNLTSGTVGKARLPQVIKPYQAVGHNGAGHVTATGVKVGDKVISATGYVTATGAGLGLDTTHFEATVTVNDQIQQSTADDLSANTYDFLVQPAS